MRVWRAAVVATCLSTAAAAQDRAALCAKAVEQLGTNLTSVWAIADGFLGIVAQARAQGRSRPEAERQVVNEVAQMMMDSLAEDHDTLERRFQNNQYALARTIYLLCGDDWPEEAAIPPEDSEVYVVE